MGADLSIDFIKRLVYIGFGAKTRVKNIKRGKIMFTNIGNKIRILAKVLCIIGIVFSCILGLVMLISGFSLFGNRYTIGVGFAMIFGGIVSAALGVLFSWIGSFVLYGYGQLIHSVQNLEKKVLGDEYESYETPAAPTYTAAPALKVCPKCGAVNANDAKFCVGCGQPLN